VRSEARISYRPKSSRRRRLLVDEAIDCRSRSTRSRSRFLQRTPRCRSPRCPARGRCSSGLPRPSGSHFSALAYSDSPNRVKTVARGVPRASSLPSFALSGEGRRRRPWHPPSDTLPRRMQPGGAQRCVSRARPDRAPAPQRRSLFDSRSNHIAKSVNWLPEIRSSATRTIVGVVISFPMKRSTTSTAPRTRPTRVIRIPSA